MWSRITALLPEERRKGILDVDAATPSTISSHAPGWIDRDRELIVGLQSDAPLKRAIMRNGGLRMVENGLRAYGYEPDPFVTKVFGSYRKTHNAGVFDAYTPQMRRARKAGIITGLPDAYGRGRIIGDYRRVALYGTARLAEAKRAERALLDRDPSTAMDEAGFLLEVESPHPSLDCAYAHGELRGLRRVTLHLRGPRCVLGSWLLRCCQLRGA